MALELLQRVLAAAGRSREFDGIDRAGETLRTLRHGVIEASGGRVVRVVARSRPTLLSWRETLPLGDRWRPAGPADRCRLYYNHPRSHSRFLALRYVDSTPGTSYATLLAALRALDRVAWWKGIDALLCDASNHRLSDRFLARQGWLPHAPAWRRRNFIKRFYGDYPPWALGPGAG